MAVQPPEFGSLDYRTLMRAMPAGVSVLTAQDAHGHGEGLTVNAVTSVSLSPPILLVCVHQLSRMRLLLSVGTPVVVNVLSQAQSDVARRFASSVNDRFSGVAHAVRPGGYVTIDGAVAHVRCTVREIAEVGDHSVVYADVTGGESNGGRPLLFYSHAYHALDGTARDG